MIRIVYAKCLILLVRILGSVLNSKSNTLSVYEQTREDFVNTKWAIVSMECEVCLPICKLSQIIWSGGHFCMGF